MDIRIRIPGPGTAAAAALACLLAAPAGAFPEFQAWSQKNSGMGVSCAMCHVHPDGPEGAGHGQIGGLSPEAMRLLNEARQAFEPGRKVHSPILNQFGNSMVEQLGRKKILELKRRPEELAAALDQKSDLDQDGVPDAREYREGTHPLRKSSGNPWILFLHNFRRHLFPVVMVTLATVCLLWGFRNLHLALERRAKLADGEEDAGLDDGGRDDRAESGQTPNPEGAPLSAPLPPAQEARASRGMSRPLYLGGVARRRRL